MFGHPSYRNRTELKALPSGGTWSARQLTGRTA